MDGATVGLVGSIACLVVVCSLGGILGTYISLKSAKGRRGRVFIRRCAAICWSTVMCYCGLLFFLPKPYRFFMSILYVILLLIGTSKVRKKHMEIRKLESGDETFTSYL